MHNISKWNRCANSVFFVKSNKIRIFRLGQVDNVCYYDICMNLNGIHFVILHSMENLRKEKHICIVHINIFSSEKRILIALTIKHDNKYSFTYIQC